jgi:hypothetical protein
MYLCSIAGERVNKIESLGDVSGLLGDVSGTLGDVSGISGDISGILGDGCRSVLKNLLLAGVVPAADKRVYRLLYIVSKCHYLGAKVEIIF